MGIKTLPNVDEMEPSYQKFIMENKNSVARYWLNMGAKGWRLDVADELPDEFLKNSGMQSRRQTPMQL